MRVLFILPFPLEADDCQIVLDFPTDLPVETANLLSYEGAGVFADSDEFEDKEEDRVVINCNSGTDSLTFDPISVSLS